jgi:hypothetical protein
MATTHDNAAPSSGGSDEATNTTKVFDKLTESQILQHQAREAQQAMSRVMGLVGSNLGYGVDPRAWARTHPWITLSAAAAGTFATVAFLIPTREQLAEKRTLRRLAAIERAVYLRHRDPGWAVRSEGTNGSGQPSPSAGRGTVRKLMDELIKTIRPAIVSALAAGIKGKMQQPEDSQSVSDVDPAAMPDAGAPG